MKNLAPIALVCFGVFTIMSCKKTMDVQATAKPTIIGNWSLVVDSITVFSGNNPTPNFTITTGIPTDYFKFNANGKLYINEGHYGLDTATYMAISDSTLNIEVTQNGTQVPYGPSNSFKIQELTDHKLTLYSWVPTSAFAMYETIYLSK